MGIVIINGQRYDATTGLRIKEQSAEQRPTDDFADLRPSVAASSLHDEQVKIAAERAAILGDAVADATVQPVKKSAKEIKHAAKTVASGNLPSWISNYVEGGAPREIKPISEAENQFRQRIRGVANTVSRRRAKGSVTLNRRYVRKPSSELAGKTYSEPLALREDRSHHIAQIRKEAQSCARHASNPTVNPARSVFAPRHHATPSLARPAATVSKSVEAASVSNAFVQPVLTKRQTANLQATKRAQTSGQVIDNFIPVQRAYRTSANSTAPINTPISTHKVKNVYNKALSNAHTAASDDISTTLQTDISPVLSDEKIDQLANAVTDALIQQERNTLQSSKVDEELRSAKRSVHLRRKRAFRMPAIATAVAALAILCGYGVYATYPNIQVRVAASKAGISVKPTVALNGFHISGPVAYSDGEITVSYRDSSGSTYSVNQRQSNESERAIRSKASSRGSDNLSYEEISAGSTNIYRYDDKATFVKDGMVYTINTNDRLTNEQISQIAKSV